jgi:arylsulfatase A-like enzyme
VPEVHGVLDDTSCYLAAPIETLGEALEREDYATGAFACNPLLDPVKNFDQGFETYDYTREMRKSDAVLPQIGAWISEHADARFFLYVHLVDPHEPVQPAAQDLARVGVSGTPPAGASDRPAVQCRTALLHGDGLTPTGELDPVLVTPREVQAWLRDTYAAAVSTADRSVGTILAWLDEHGLAENTIVAFTSDHGEELFDHGFLGHDHTLYQELVRVPMILAGPGIAAGKRVATPVSNRHLAWTLAARAGARLTGPADPIDLGSPELIAERKIHFSTEHGWWWNDHRTTILGVLEWPFVLHVYPDALPFGSPKGTQPGEGIVRLYDLVSDPRETKDLSKEKPELVEDAEAVDARAPARPCGAAAPDGAGVGRGDERDAAAPRVRGRRGEVARNRARPPWRIRAGSRGSASSSANRGRRARTEVAERGSASPSEARGRRARTDAAERGPTPDRENEPGRVSSRAMPTPLRVALIGQKFMGRAHSNAWGQVNRFFDGPLGAEMRIVAGRDAKELAAFAMRWGWNGWTDDWRTIAQDPEIDLVDVSTPNDVHAEPSIAMLEAGSTSRARSRSPGRSRTRAR